MASNDSFFYANAVSLSVSAFDFQLEFQRQAPVQSSTPPPMEVGQTQSATSVEIRDRLTVATTPQHMKALIVAAVRSLREYERLNGAVTAPADLQRAYEELFEPQPVPPAH